MFSYILIFDFRIYTVANITGRKKKITTGMATFAKDFGYKIRLCGTKNQKQRELLKQKIR